MPLVLAAKMNEPPEKAYFESAVRPLLRDTDFVFGEADQIAKRLLLSSARCLLFPIRWEEPFGIVMIEAMACGTPVIAFRCGSVPEVIDDGESGRIVDSVAEAVAAVERLGDLDRRRVRATFETRFSARRMAEDYVDLYRGLAGVRTEAAHLRRVRGTELGLQVVA